MLMIEGMTMVVSDVNIGVTYAGTNRLHKEAEAVFSEDGQNDFGLGGAQLV